MSRTDPAVGDVSGDERSQQIDKVRVHQAHVQGVSTVPPTAARRAAHVRAAGSAASTRRRHGRPRYSTRSGGPSRLDEGDRQGRSPGHYSHGELKVRATVSRGAEAPRDVGGSRWYPVRRMRLLLALAAAALAATSGLAATSAPAASYDERRAMAVKECEAIDPAKYQSGLYFNPDGYRSYYLRSECFQRLAVRFRDQSPCARVKQRRSLFASSWGYSAKNCRALVESGLAKDRAELTEVRRAYL